MSQHIDPTPKETSLEAVSMKINNFIKTMIEQNTDLNDLTTPGFYCSPNTSVTGTLLHCPVTAGFSMIVMPKGNYQTQFINYSTRMYGREKTSSGWGSWYVYEGTMVTM